jgi:hypothetical protein
VLTRTPASTDLDGISSLQIGSVSAVKVRNAFLVLAVAWQCIAAKLAWRLTFDDSYIFFRYARNFSNGLGIVYNPGQRVEGYTGFLWELLLGGGVRLGMDVVLVSKILGMTCGILTLVAVWMLCRMLSAANAPLLGGALLLTATSTHIIESYVAGLEIALFTALFCWNMVVLIAVLREEDRGAPFGWLIGSSILFAVLVMTRPDGILTYVALWLVVARKFRRRLSALMAFTLPFVLLYGGYFLWRFHYYGLLFPNTFYAKRGGTPALFAKGLTEIGKFLGLETGGWVLALIVALGAMLAGNLEITILALAIVTRFAFELWSGGVSAGEFHFLLPTLPVFWVLAETLGSRWVVPWSKSTLRAGFVIVACLAILQAAAYLVYVKHRVVPVEAGMAHAHVALGKWLDANASKNATVAVGDIGAIGWWSHRDILDLDGLTDTHISHLPGGYSEKRDSGYVLQQSPEEIVLRSSSCAPEANNVRFGMDQAIFADPRFVREYSGMGCWEFWPQYDLVLYARRVPRKSR